MSLVALNEVFARLGARNPGDWARSQLDEGIPQLARFLFLRQAWRSVVLEDDRTWIAAQLNIEPNGPGGAINAALTRLLSLGASEQDLTIVVRVMQWRLLAGLCDLLDSPGESEDEVANVAWRLFQIDNGGEPIAVMAGLRESVLEVEPSGREMQPRDPATA